MNPIVKAGNKLRWQFENMTNLAENPVFSPKFSIEGVDWKIQVRTGYHTGNDQTIKKHLTLFLCYYLDNYEEKTWICEFDAKLKLLNQSAIGKNWVKERKCCMRKDSENWGFSSFIDWDEMISSYNGYLKDDSIVVEIDFDFKYYDFSKKIPNFTDIIVKVEDAQFHVNKWVLCSKSEYFYNLLINEGNQESVVQLEDIKATELCFILASLNSFFDGINELNFEEVINTAKKFKVSSLHYKCEQFLIAYQDLKLIEKIKYAENNGYDKLMKTCVESLKSGEDIKLLHADVKFAQLNEVTKLRIMQRFLDFY